MTLSVRTRANFRLAALACALASASAFSTILLPRYQPTTTLHMAKAAKSKKNIKKNRVSSGGAAATKGFGAPPVLKADKSVEIDRSTQTRAFYGQMEQLDAQDNLNRCMLAQFQITDDFRLRGVVATKAIPKGEPIIRIPYELAINLGPEGSDPTIPALEFLKEYCQTLGDDGGAQDTTRAPYYRMLPPYRGDDCLGSTDFFSDDALDALQYPLVKSETLLRRQLTQARFDRAITDGELDGLTWIDGTTPLSADHLQWAVWIITSRVLTVQGNDNASYRLLIPFLDMCNHDRNSPHVLSGRAAPGGELKVVAGANVRAGEQINICYGGGQAGNDRFVQDYGFLDTTGRTEDAGYLMIAQQLLGKRRLLEGSGRGQYVTEEDREETLELLRQTTMAEDSELIATGTSDPGLLSAYQFRLGVKKALSKFIVMQ